MGVGEWGEEEIVGWLDLFVSENLLQHVIRSSSKGKQRSVEDHKQAGGAVPECKHPRSRSPVISCCVPWARATSACNKHADKQKQRLVDTGANARASLPGRINMHICKDNAQNLSSKAMKFKDECGFPST